MNELTTTNERFPSPTSWQHITAIAEELGKSKALPAFIDNPGKLAMVLLAGKEAGMGAVEALNSFYIVNGRLTIFGAAVLTQLKRSGWKVKWGECNDKKSTVTLISPEGDETTETYTWEEAVKGGQTNNEPWKKYPKNMLRWKVIGNAIRFTCPEVLHGKYVKEDIEGAPPSSVIEVSDDPTDVTNDDDGTHQRIEEDLSKPNLENL